MSIKAKPSFSLKDQLFNQVSVRTLSNGLKKASSIFETRKFERAVLKEFPNLELKDRIRWMVTQLKEFLPGDFAKALKVLLKTLPPPLDPALQDDDFGQFIWVVPGEYVATYGCEEQYLTLSLPFLREATKRFSSESALRPFLNKYPQQSLDFVHECAADNNYHVRRLASEGIRPFLPWAERVMLPEKKVIEVLNVLHADNTRYVTRSVANTLNDLAKLDASLVVNTLMRWQKQNRQKPEELAWMIRHSLRTLLKQDNAEALQLLGYPLKPKFRIANMTISNQVKVGENLFCACVLTSSATQSLKITLQIYFLKANGSHSTKVFAVKDAVFNKGETIDIAKSLSFKPITTRVMYAGTHYAEVLVNGISRGKHAFELRT